MGSEQDKKQDKGKAGDSGSKPKKKIIIKKTSSPQNKDISELFGDRKKKGPAADDRRPGGDGASTRKSTGPSPAGDRRPGGSPHKDGSPSSQGRSDSQSPGGKKIASNGPTPISPERSPVVSRAKKEEPQQSRPDRPDSGRRDGPGGPRPQDRGGRPPAGRPADRKPGSSGNAFAKASTPFDNIIDSGKKGDRRPPRGGTPARGRGPGGQNRGPSGGPGGASPDRPAGIPPGPDELPPPDSAGSGKTGGRGRQKGAGPGGRKGGGPPRKEEREGRFPGRFEKKRQPAQSGTTVPKSIEIMETIQVGELAKKLNLKPSDVIAKMMKMGEMVTINKAIDAETASLLAAEFDCEVKVVSLFDETVIEEEEDRKEDRTNRPPVVTIMGHVDHGKTKLLDTIRKTNVIDTEAGAITQHIGAYQVVTPGGKITFLDTPGHEAFTAMRARGAAVTDIVILVVAADDGVKEQTVEAIRHAQDAEVPIIVAINKVDLETASPDRVKQELVGYGLQPEEWGGTTIFAEISAKQNTGIENLLDMVLIQAEFLELTANPEVRGIGHVIEARIDAGKGPVATVLIEKGTLREGDPYVVGIYSGRVRAMFDDLGRRIQEAPPSTPVEITGIDGVPEAGDPFTVVETEKYGREIAGKRQHYKHVTESAQRTQPSLGDLKNWIQDHKELKVIIKADVQGSVEAIKDGLSKLSTDEVKVRVIHGATGAISEGDVNLAAASAGIVIGFQVRATPRALQLAEQTRVEIKYYSIIYKVIEEITAAMEGLLEPEKVEEVTGQAEVRQIFRISRLGNIAGCMVLSGKIHRKNKVRVIRENVVISTTDIKSLRREKDDVNEISEGFECGLNLESFNDLQEGDILESFEVKEVARKLSS